MNIGYASKTLALPAAQMKSITAKRATEETLVSAIRHNLQALDVTLDYCAENKIHLFRISSDVIPFGSSPVNQLNWAVDFAQQLKALGEKARANSIRLSMHPGQYTVLNSPNSDVVQRAIDDLLYHARFLDALELETNAKIVLHVGGLYDDRDLAMTRFVERFKNLDSSVKRRLVLENDDRLFTAEDVLSLSYSCGVPMVFDVLHHALNRSSLKSAQDFIAEATQTWQEADGRQKIHYSQQAFGKRPGSHSDTISLAPFLEFLDKLGETKPDIMLEVKDKNISAVKCITALNPEKKITDLEREWARYKYLVLEHDQAVYQQIRSLLNDKKVYPVLEFYQCVERSLAKPFTLGSARNALQHVWGYVSDKVTLSERRSFERLMERFEQGDTPLASVKKRLSVLAARYNQDYLTSSYYFSL